MGTVTFIFNSILLGIGLAMDAFSVSIANGLNEPQMRRRRECLIAGTYGFFQFLMPVAGWFCVHSLVQQFRAFEPFIPWIALALLAWIGGKMVLEGVRDAKAGPATQVAESAAAEQAPGAREDDDAPGARGDDDAPGARTQGGAAEHGPNARQTGAPEAGVVLGMGTLLLQGVATSIDALSVGFAIAGYRAAAALTAALIIAVVTFLICMGGLTVGRKLGEKLTGKAGILGGCILIFIGLEIFIRGVLL